MISWASSKLFGDWIFSDIKEIKSSNANDVSIRYESSFTVELIWSIRVTSNLAFWVLVNLSLFIASSIASSRDILFSSCGFVDNNSTNLVKLLSILSFLLSPL